MITSARYISKDAVQVETVVGSFIHDPTRNSCPQLAEPLAEWEAAGNVVEPYEPVVLFTPPPKRVVTAATARSRMTAAEANKIDAAIAKATAVDKDGQYADPAAAALANTLVGSPQYIAGTEHYDAQRKFFVDQLGKKRADEVLQLEF